MSILYAVRCARLFTAFVKWSCCAHCAVEGASPQRFAFLWCERAFGLTLVQMLEPIAMWLQNWVLQDIFLRTCRCSHALFWVDCDAYAVSSDSLQVCVVRCCFCSMTVLSGLWCGCRNSISDLLVAVCVVQVCLTARQSWCPCYVHLFVPKR